MKAIINGIEVECTVDEFKQIINDIEDATSTKEEAKSTKKSEMNVTPTITTKQGREVIVRHPKKKERTGNGTYDYQRAAVSLARRLMRDGKVIGWQQAMKESHRLMKEKKERNAKAIAPIFVEKPGFPDIRHILPQDKDRFINYIKNQIIGRGYTLSYPSIAATYGIENYVEWQEFVESFILNQTTILDYFGRRDGCFVLEMQASSKVSRPIHMISFHKRNVPKTEERQAQAEDIISLRKRAKERWEEMDPFVRTLLKAGFPDEYGGLP